MKHIDFIKLSPSRFMVVEIQPLPVPDKEKLSTARTTKWMLPVHWKELNTLLHNITKEYEDSHSDVLKLNGENVNRQTEIIVGKLIKIGYKYEKYHSCCHFLLPKLNAHWSDDDTSDLEDKGGRYMSMRPCGDKLMVSVIPVDMSGVSNGKINHSLKQELAASCISDYFAPSDWKQGIGGKNGDSCTMDSQKGGIASKRKLRSRRLKKSNFELNITDFSKPKKESDNEDDDQDLSKQKESNAHQNLSMYGANGASCTNRNVPSSCSTESVGEGIIEFEDTYDIFQKNLNPLHCHKSLMDTTCITSPILVNSSRFKTLGNTSNAYLVDSDDDSSVLSCSPKFQNSRIQKQNSCKHSKINQRLALSPAVGARHETDADMVTVDVESSKKEERANLFDSRTDWKMSSFSGVGLGIAKTVLPGNISYNIPNTKEVNKVLVTRHVRQRKPENRTQFEIDRESKTTSPELFCSPELPNLYHNQEPYMKGNKLSSIVNLTISTSSGSALGTDHVSMGMKVLECKGQGFLSKNVLHSSQERIYQLFGDVSPDVNSGEIVDSEEYIPLATIQSESKLQQFLREDCSTNNLNEECHHMTSSDDPCSQSEFPDILPQSPIFKRSCNQLCLASSHSESVLPCLSQPSSSSSGCSRLPLTSKTILQTLPNTRSQCKNLSQKQCDFNSDEKNGVKIMSKNTTFHNQKESSEGISTAKGNTVKGKIQARGRGKSAKGKSVVSDMPGLMTDWLNRSNKPVTLSVAPVYEPVDVPSASAVVVLDEVEDDVFPISPIILDDSTTDAMDHSPPVKGNRDVQSYTNLLRITRQLFRLNKEEIIEWLFKVDDFLLRVASAMEPSQRHEIFKSDSSSCRYDKFQGLKGSAAMVMGFYDYNLIEVVYDTLYEAYYEWIMKKMDDYLCRQYLWNVLLPTALIQILAEMEGFTFDDAESLLYKIFRTYPDMCTKVQKGKI